MKNGIDVLGGVKYQSAVFKTVPKDFVIGVFAKEFGDALPFVKKAVAKGYKNFRIQMLWSKAHSYGDKDIPELKRLGKAYEQIAKADPSVCIQLSPFCEYRSVSNIDKYLDIVNSVAPSCWMVASPEPGNNTYSKHYLNEIHSKFGVKLKLPPIGFNYSLDGRDQFNTDIKDLLNTYKNADIFYLWAPGCNCHKDENDPLRNNPATPEYLEAMLYELGYKGTCNLPKGTLLKPMSEKWKPVLITPKRYAKIEFRKNGKSYRFDPQLPYADGRYRCYISTPGYKLGIGEIYADGKKLGDVDMGYRINEYH